MEKRGLPIGSWPEYTEADSQKPRKNGTPIGVDGMTPIAAQIGAGDVQITVSIHADPETRGPSLKKAGANGDDPDDGAQEPQISLRVSGLVPERKLSVSHAKDRSLLSWCVFFSPQREAACFIPPRDRALYRTLPEARRPIG